LTSALGRLLVLPPSKKEPARSFTLEVLDRAGLLFNEPPVTDEVPFI
jgi:hypothetical protein